MAARRHTWLRAARSLQSYYSRPVQAARQYSGARGPAPTYFQPPPQPPKPQRRVLRNLLFGTSCLVVGVGIGLLGGVQITVATEDSDLNLTEDGTLPSSFVDEQVLYDGSNCLMDIEAALYVPNVTPELAHAQLYRKSYGLIAQDTITHHSQLSSNLPCEDVMQHSIPKPEQPGPDKRWSIWGIFDGHAGPSTAHWLSERLHQQLLLRLMDLGCMGSSTSVPEQQITEAIKREFVSLDTYLLGKAEDAVVNGEITPQALSQIAPAMSGSCALVAMYDPQRSIVRIANTGDSRAVLGRWDSNAARYEAIEMTKDHTGFNEQEVERLNREHPGESPVDPKTGRVHGIAVTRAFGDSRWKWSEKLSRLAHEKLWGLSPRPNGMIKSPAYLTAEPEVSSFRLQGGSKPEFLIMASDGLWDKISSDDAVTCVQQWLEKHAPTDVTLNSTMTEAAREWPELAGAARGRTGGVADEDTYYDAEQGSVSWKVSPKHFANEDIHCGVHLLKNALGGSRRNLLMSVLTLQPPLSREVRDDISINVIFFGQDTSKMDLTSSRR